MIKADPSRSTIGFRKSTDGSAVLFSGRRQPIGWPALLLSLSLHGALFAGIAWLSFGGQGHDGTEGMENSDDDVAAAPVPVLQNAPRQPPRIQPRKVSTFSPANAPRLLSISPTANMMLPKWDMQPMSPLAIAAPAPAAATEIRPAYVTETKTIGTAAQTRRKAAGKGNGSGMGSAQVNVRPPQVLSSYPPPYPAKARREHVEGTTVVRVTVSDQGRVIQCSVHRSAGDAGLDTAALRAVKGWRFSPASTGAADVLVRVTFRLS